MQTSHRARLAICLVGLVVAGASVSASSPFAGTQGAKSEEVPVVKGKAGPCSADFAVKDSLGKGLFDAKISIQIRYRFGGFHRLELEVGTNAEGKARFEGLPEEIKRPTEFKIRHGDQSKSVPYEPQTNCHPRHEVTLGEKQAPG